jgi:hypothetical protein
VCSSDLLAYRGAADINLTQNAYWLSGAWRYGGTTGVGVSAYQQVDGTHRWQVAPSGTAGNTITFTQAMTLDADGDLGIGDTTPNERLSVRNTAGRVSIFLASGTTNQGYISYFNATQQLSFGCGSPTGTGTNGGQQVNIDVNGNLLVGTTSLPTSSVSVAGVGVFNASGTAGRINLGKTASGTLDGLANYHNGTYVGGITYSNTATALVASSDERLKENIVAAPPALEKAMSIEVVSYDWKHDPTHVEFGLVAQRLNSIYSEAVNVGDDGEEVEKTWGVEYGRLTPMLLKAIQEQQQMIETLQAKVAALEAK